MPEELVNFIATIPNILLIVKIGMLVLELFYLSFSFVLIRQLHVMAKTLIVPVSKVFRIMVYIHFILALGILVLTLILL